MNIFINIVVGIAANKNDLIDKEQVSEEEARKYAKSIGAIFRTTSACTSAGIEELFKSIGCKVLNPNYKDDEESPTPSPSPNTGGQNKPEQPKAKDDKGIKLNDKKPEKEKKKGFC